MKPGEVHPTIKKHMIGDGDAIVFDWKKSHGIYLVDALTGREYIDFFTFFASQPIGYNHPKMQDPEFLEKLMAAAITKPSNSDIYTTMMAEFVEAFHRVAMPKDMPHLFLVSGGALAVENGLKTAFDWKLRKNMKSLAAANGGMPAVEGMGSRVIHFRESFHGRSGYTLSLTNTDDPRKYLYFPKFSWPRVVNPKLRFPVDDHVLADVMRVEEIALTQIESAVRHYPGDIAALIIEPIQGEGGDNHFRPEFMAALRRMADEHEFLFIVDEIQSGMGSTGKMWAMEHYGVKPDIIAFGKKAQVCGIIVGPRIEEVAGHVFEESSRINSTWGGNLVDMVRSTRYLQIIEEDKLVEHTAKVGAKMIEGLEGVAAESKGTISNVRGRGLMLAFDLPDKAGRDEMMKRMKTNGLYALKSGPNSIRFRGMLDTPEDVVEDALKIVAASIPLG